MSREEQKPNCVSRVKRSLWNTRGVDTVAWQLGEVLHRGRRVFGPTRPEIAGTYRRIKSVPSEYQPVYNDIAPPLSPEPAGVPNPVITAAEVTDFGDADSVADPFLVLTDDGEWFMFFEVHNRQSDPTAAIGHAVSLDGGSTWTYGSIVLETENHLSFPFVFMWEDEYYLIPDAFSDTGSPAPLSLYRTQSLPDGWTRCAELVQPTTPIHDCIVFRWHDRWWAIAGDGVDLYCFYSDTLKTDYWEPHENNPVVEKRPFAARPGGRPLVLGDSLFVPLQDCSQSYGTQLRAFEITDLSPTTYNDIEYPNSPILQPSEKRFGWNSGRMHHIDAFAVDDGWFCAVDGNIGFGDTLFGIDHWAIGIYMDKTQ